MEGKFVISVYISSFKYYLRFPENNIAGNPSYQGLINNATFFDCIQSANAAKPKVSKFWLMVEPVRNRSECVIKKIPFHKRLKALRKSKKYTQAYVADALKLHKKTYLAYEQNTSFPVNDCLIKMSQFFNITIDELVKGPKTKILNS